MDIDIGQLDAVTTVEIDGKPIKNVVGYKITSCSDGSTEIYLKLRIDGTLKEFSISEGKDYARTNNNPPTC